MAPRWFYPLIAVCAVVITLSFGAYVAVHRDTGRWVPIYIGGGLVRIVDSRTGVACQTTVTNRYRWCLRSPVDAPLRDSIVADQP